MDDKTEQFRSRLYEAYVSAHRGEKPADLTDNGFYRLVRDRLPLEPRIDVCDIGCGQGGLVAALQRSGYVSVVGIDASPEQVQLAHSRGLTSVMLGDFREDLVPDSLDVITAIDVFEHFDKFEVLSLLDECRKALRSGGQLMFQVPNAMSPFGGKYRHGDVTHESWYTSSSVRQLLAAAGFADCSVLAVEPVVHGWKSAGRWVVWKAASSAMKLAIAAESGVPRGHIVSMNLFATATK